MANTKPAAKADVKPAATVADTLDEIGALAARAAVFEAHGQIGAFVAQLQALVAQAKAAL